MSSDAAVVVDGVNYGQRLPRGRHGIPNELVIANQRERLLAAATTIFAERGYAALAVSNVIERAGVSRATFYKLFEDKLDCVLAAQKRVLGRLDETISDACSGQREWPMAVGAAVEAALAFATRFPADAQLALASGHAASEPQLARQELGIHQRLLERLRVGAKRCPSARSPGDLSERAAVGAAISLVGACLCAGEVESLDELRPGIVQIVLAPYLGVNEAKRVATAA